jgi:probable HAF family extracellular repeat protein
LAFGQTSAALAINNNGQVVGELDAGSVWTAFVQSGQSFTLLGTLGGASSSARGINSEGNVVGYSLIPGSGYHAFLNSSGHMTDLGTLGGIWSQANAINDNNQIIGWAYATGGTKHAFLDQDGIMTDLGTLGGVSSEANAINNEGQVVGDFEVKYQDYAFLFEDGAMVDLNSLISASSGWDLAVATDINDQGDIVGYGENSAGNTDGFLLIPVPEPVSTALLGIGGLILFLRRRH